MLSRQYLETGIPTVKDHLVARVYGLGALPQVQLPQPKFFKLDDEIVAVTPGGARPVYKKSSKPRVKSFKAIDVGDRVIPLVVMDNGEVIFPGELYKKLSPKDREMIRLRKKELGFKIRKLKDEEGWRQFLKWYKEQDIKLRQKGLSIKERQAGKPLDLDLIMSRAEKWANDRVKTLFHKDQFTGQWIDVKTQQTVPPETVNSVREQLILDYVRRFHPDIYNNVFGYGRLSNTWEEKEMQNLNDLPQQRSVFDLFKGE